MRGADRRRAIPAANARTHTRTLISEWLQRLVVAPTRQRGLERELQRAGLPGQRRKVRGAGGRRGAALMGRRFKAEGVGGQEVFERGRPPPSRPAWAGCGESNGALRCGAEVEEYSSTNGGRDTCAHRMRHAGNEDCCCVSSKSSFWTDLTVVGRQNKNLDKLPRAT